MKTSDFDYDLPRDRIAQTPLPERDQARMLVLFRDSGAVAHHTVRDLPDFLESGDVLVLNDTRVIPARVFGWRRDTRAKIEVLLVEEQAPGLWSALCRTKSALKPGVPLSLAADRIQARVVDRTPDGRVTLAIRSSGDLRAVLEEAGSVPLPPYIKRRTASPEELRRDRERYQTVYATQPGAVAAPTAGLHFTQTLLGRLEQRGVRIARLTLHVGPGTFRPVKTESPADHTIEAERYRIPEATVHLIHAARSTGRRVVAVGTTVVRALETAVRVDGGFQPGGGRTSLFVYPPFTFRIVDGLLTNFHLPRSTLLMLVSAFAAPPGADGSDADLGRRRVLAAYQEAIRLGYRFYSYGDCMLLLPSDMPRR